LLLHKQRATADLMRGVAVLEDVADGLLHGLPSFTIDVPVCRPTAEGPLGTAVMDLRPGAD
jgi:hypothetical protein